MKKSVIALILCLFTLQFAFAQEKKERRVYCELLGTSKLFSNKVKITIDFGQETSFWSFKKGQQLVDDSGKEMKFNSMIDAMNYMGQFGWIFASNYVIGDAKSGYVYHWLLYKDIENDDQLLEGFMTKNLFLESKGIPGGNNVLIQFCKRNIRTNELEIVKEETKKDITQEEINKIVDEWQEGSTEKYENTCIIKRK